MYLGYLMGLFFLYFEVLCVVVINGMMIFNYFKLDDWECYNVFGVIQYGQMMVGLYMYIGLQGIVYGIIIIVMNGFWKILFVGESFKGKIFLMVGFGGMSGVQFKVGNIVGCIMICVEVNFKVVWKCYEQGWVDVLVDDIEELVM